MGNRVGYLSLTNFLEKVENIPFVIIDYLEFTMEQNRLESKTLLNPFLHIDAFELSRI